MCLCRKLVSNRSTFEKENNIPWESILRVRDDMVRCKGAVVEGVCEPHEKRWTRGSHSWFGSNDQRGIELGDMWPWRQG